MQTNDRLAPTSAAHRRRRHLSVYHRALRTAKTPEQRSAVAARYRQLLITKVDEPRIADATEDAGTNEVTPLKMIHRSVTPDAVRLAS